MLVCVPYREIWNEGSAGVAYGIGHGIKALQQLYARSSKIAGAFYRALAHGLSRAVIRVVQGGKALGGFLSGFAGSLFGGFAKDLDNVDTITKTIMVAVAGGTASMLGGGKFANGAMSAAFVFMFNEMVVETRKIITSIKNIKYRYKSGYIPPRGGGSGTALWHKTYDETSYLESRNTYIDGEGTNTEWERTGNLETQTVTETIPTHIQGIDLTGGYSSRVYTHAIIYHPDGHTFLVPVRSH